LTSDPNSRTKAHAQTQSARTDAKAEQYKRFKEATKKAGVTNDEKEFERVFKGVASQKSAFSRRAKRHSRP